MSSSIAVAGASGLAMLLLLRQRKQRTEPIEFDHEQIADFRSRGFLIVPKLYSREEMKTWKRLIKEDQAMQKKDTLGNNAQSSGVSVWLADTVPKYFLDRLSRGRIGQVLTQLIGPCEFLSTKPVLKTGVITFASPWHQDHAYWYGCPKTSVWIAIDDASVSNGCLKVIPGRQVFIDHEQHSEAIGFDMRVPPSAINKEEVVNVEIKSGDALFFTDLTLHASNPNQTGEDRYCMIPSYRPTTVEDSSKIWTCGHAVQPTACAL
jgi:hypothetical protein